MWENGVWVPVTAAPRPPALAMLQDYDAESYWPAEYLAEVEPLLLAGGWLTRSLTPSDYAAVSRCMDAVADLDQADTSPFAVLWALRTSAAIAPSADLDEALLDWRRWEETERIRRPLDLPPLPTGF